MINLDSLKEFVFPYYENKDIMHNFVHIERVILTTKSLLKNISKEIDNDAIILGAYFHGFVYSDEDKIMEWLINNDFDETKSNFIIQIARESQKDEEAKSLEGQILHDAHMIECGKVFLIVKCLVTGSVRGQTLEETIDYVEKNILGKGFCYTEEAKQIYENAQKYAKSLIDDLKAGLEGEI